VAASVSKTALAVACDVTDSAAVKAAIAAVVARFGGIDIVVSNAGAAFQGMIATVDEAVMRKSFELNFYGHQRIAQAAVAVMKAQGFGGALLFNVSKQADRIRSNLLTSEMIAARSKARGLSEADYMGGNLLGREVTAEDVAQAFVHHALMQSTTGDVTTVDGGNVSAMLR
jgi:NAD(P)-dependent dehydrogenase (short-subunit alcohol dehydrogenase family)